MYAYTRVVEVHSGNFSRVDESQSAGSLAGARAHCLVRSFVRIHRDPSFERLCLLLHYCHASLNCSSVHLHLHYSPALFLHLHFAPSLVSPHLHYDTFDGETGIGRGASMRREDANDTDENSTALKGREKSGSVCESGVGCVRCCFHDRDGQLCECGCSVEIVTSRRTIASAARECRLQECVRGV